MFSDTVDEVPIDLWLGGLRLSQRSITLAAQPNPDANRPIRPVVDPTLAIGDVFPVSIHGSKCEESKMGLPGSRIWAGESFSLGLTILLVQKK